MISAGEYKKRLLDKLKSVSGMIVLDLPNGYSLAAGYFHDGIIKEWEEELFAAFVREGEKEATDIRNMSVASATYVEEDIVIRIKAFNDAYLKDQLISDLIIEYIVAGEEERSYILYDNIWDRMNELAPEGYYFGSRPGHGADFGFWPIDDEEGE